MIVQDVRVDWLFAFEVGKQGKYGACIMLPKGSDQEKQVKKVIDKAITAGIAAGKFTAANTKSASFKKCLRDGDFEIETEDRPKHYAGMSFFNCSNKNQPGIIGPDLQPLLDKDKLFSGCYVNVDVDFYAYNHPKGGKGVGSGLNHIMLVREGERLDGRQSAEEAFADLKPADDLE